MNSRRAANCDILCRALREPPRAACRHSFIMLTDSLLYFSSTRQVKSKSTFSQLEHIKIQLAVGPSDNSVLFCVTNCYTIFCTIKYLEQTNKMLCFLRTCVKEREMVSAKVPYTFTHQATHVNQVRPPCAAHAHSARYLERRSQAHLDCG